MKGILERPNEAEVAEDNEKSVQSLFDSFRQGIAEVVDDSLSTLVEDEWMRTTISTALTVHLQKEADRMAIATIEELRCQIKQNNESHSTKLNANRMSYSVRMETQKVELTAANEVLLLQQQRELQAKYAADASEAQQEVERLKQSLESSLTKQLASQAALQKSRKETAALEAQVSEYTRAIEKLEANVGAQQELEDMKKALQAEVKAVRRLPQTLGYGCPLTTGVAMHRSNWRCVGRSIQCNRS